MARRTIEERISELQAKQKIQLDREQARALCDSVRTLLHAREYVAAGDAARVLVHACDALSGGPALPKSDAKVKS